MERTLRTGAAVFAVYSLVAGCGGVAVSGSGDASSEQDSGRGGPPEAGLDAGSDAKADAADGTSCTGRGCCSEHTREVIWKSLDHQPLILANDLNRRHRTLIGIDFSGPDQSGTPIADVPLLICQGTPLGSSGAFDVEAWGLHREVQILYETTGEQVAHDVHLLPGYLGSLDLHADPAGPDSGHVFAVRVADSSAGGASTVTLDGAPFTIDWTDPTFAAGNRLYNALAYTNIHGYVGYDPDPCITSGFCTVTVSGGVRRWSFPTQGVTLDFADPGQPAASAVVEMEISVTACSDVWRCLGADATCVQGYCK